MTNLRISEIDKELFILEMKDKFNDEDRAMRDKLTAERRALFRAESRVVEAPEIEEMIIESEVKKMKSESLGICLIEDIEISTFTQTLKKIGEFQALVKSQLAQDHDYGIIPGTSKPTLLKPGAEKILMLMGLTSEFDILDSTRDFYDGFSQYQVKCRLYKNGVLITEGLGACNSKEKKYAYTDSCNVDNTILKMAKKWALIDATLLVASLSQIFTQDIEDMELRQEKPPRAETILKVVNGNQETAINDGSTPKTMPMGQSSKNELITEKQAKRMFAISKGNAKLCRQVCKKYGYKTSQEIKKADYDSICAEIQQSA